MALATGLVVAVMAALGSTASAEEATPGTRPATSPPAAAEAGPVDGLRLLVNERASIPQSTRSTATTGERCPSG